MKPLNDKINGGTENSQKQCFSYIRFSSKIQAKGDSLRRQMEIAPRVAKEKGWILRDDLCAQNLGMSAHKGENLETIKDIIVAAKKGKIPAGTVMIIEAFDRFSRTDIDVAEDVLKDTLRAGLEIYVDRGGHHLTKESLNKPIDRIIALLELAAANEYSAKLSYRTGKAWRQKKMRAADGVVMSKCAPAWLDVDKANNKITPNEKVAVLKRIFTSYANNKGIRTIMRELNAEKVAPFGKGNQNKEKCWSSTHIARTLANRAVIGEYQPCRYEGCYRKPDGEPIVNYYPSVIEKELFYKVQESLNRTRQNIKTGKTTRGHAAGPKGNVTNLFTGLVKCPHCGSSMVIKQSPCQGGKYHYTSLLCYNAMRGNGCKYATMLYSSVERAILTMLITKIVPAMAEMDTKQDKLITLKGELQQAEKQFKKWMTLFADDEAAPDEVKAKLNYFDTRKKVLKREIETVSASADQNPLADWQPVPNTPDNRLRLQSLLANEIESLTVDAQNRKVQVKFKNQERTFNIEWPKSQGSNQVNPNLSLVGFIEDGKTIPYLDDVLIWDTRKDLNLESVMGLLKCTDEVATMVYECGAISLQDA